MASNLIVDVSQISNLLARVSAIETAAKTCDYYIYARGMKAAVNAAPLPIHGTHIPLQLEAIVITQGTKTSWKNWNSNTITYTYKLQRAFTHPPVVVGNYEGSSVGAVVTFEQTNSDAKDVIVRLTKRTGTWKYGRDKFNINLLAIGV